MPLADLPDADLVGRTMAGEPAAFEVVMRRHHDVVWRVAFLSARDHMAAEELTQDTFLKAYGALGQWRGDASLRTWLCTICRRLCIDRARRKRLDTAAIEDAAPGGLADPAAPAAEGLAERFDLQAALDALPADEREAFLLIHHQGHSSFDAAAILDVPPSTLRSRIGQARTKLAAMLDPSLAGGGP